jgi:hypothetical protein
MEIYEMWDCNITPDNAMRQASMTASQYMIEAIESIDRNFGKGYAKAHPELVGAFINACAKDFHSTAMAMVLKEIAEALGELDFG